MARNQERVRVEVELTVEQVEGLDEAVRSGQFRNQEDAIFGAVTEWNDSRKLSLSDQELKRLWDEGIASGDFQQADEVFQRLRERITKRLDDE